LHLLQDTVIDKTVKYTEMCVVNILCILYYQSWLVFCWYCITRMPSKSQHWQCMLVSYVTY